MIDDICGVQDSKEDLDSMKLVSSSVDASVKPREEKKKIHWSHLEPIANNEVCLSLFLDVASW